MKKIELAEELIFYRYVINLHPSFYGTDAVLLTKYQPIVLDKSYIKQLRKIIFTKSRGSYYIDEYHKNPDGILVNYVCRHCNNKPDRLSDITSKVYVVHSDCINQKICAFFGESISVRYDFYNGTYIPCRTYKFSNNFELFPNVPIHSS